MKKLMFVFAVLPTVLVWADSAQPQELDPDGGILERAYSIPSKQINVDNRQKILDAKTLNEVVHGARLASRLPVAQNVQNAPATIELAERDDVGALTIHVEEFRAVVNVKALSKDGAKPDVVAERTKKEVVRAALMLLGSGLNPFCVTRPLKTLAELDKIGDAFSGPEAMVHLTAANMLGVKQIRFATYRQACAKGWAPAPTNDSQRAIWAEFHSKPTEPIKIKFDPKAGK